jgi:hypothetical protein
MRTGAQPRCRLLRLSRDPLDFYEVRDQLLPTEERLRTE